MFSKNKIIVISLFSIFIIYDDAISQKTKPCGCEKMSKQAALLASFKQTTPAGMVWIPAGQFKMGGFDKSVKSDELPIHEVKIDGFFMDETEVTNQEFVQFVKATHYQTTAEKPVDWNELKKQLPPNTPKPSDDKLKPGSLVFVPTNHPVNFDDYSQWWQWVRGADWRHPLGPRSKIFGLDHPVVQVSWYDANAYCHWLGKRLPTEAEREWAARGGIKDQIYPWGNEDIAVGKIKANTWQGSFPYQNDLKDKYYWTSPVRAYPANAYGLYDMAGNVWEWTQDLYDANYYTLLKKQGLVINPKNLTSSFDPDEPGVKKYVLKGGSFLCNKSYCAGFRVASRMKSPPDTSLVNTGFRCVKS